MIPPQVTTIEPFIRGRFNNTPEYSVPSDSSTTFIFCSSFAVYEAVIVSVEDSAFNTAISTFPVV